jgi:hypothetical protein
MSLWLRQPKTHYVIITRDYVDWLWSSYNFWIREGESSSLADWADALRHTRSVEEFESLVLSYDKTAVHDTDNFFFDPKTIAKHPQSGCTQAPAFYRNYISAVMSHFGEENTIVVASEMLHKNPRLIWERIISEAGLADLIGYNHDFFTEFSGLRINSNDRKGSMNILRTGDLPGKLEHGLYQISKFQKVSPRVREFLYDCWERDCLWVSNMTGYRYPACHKRAQQLYVHAYVGGSSAAPQPVPWLALFCFFVFIPLLRMRSPSVLSFWGMR